MNQNFIKALARLANVAREQAKGVVTSLDSKNLEGMTLSNVKEIAADYFADATISVKARIIEVRDNLTGHIYVQKY